MIDFLYGIARMFVLLVLVAGVFRFFPWTRRPWLAVALAAAGLLVWAGVFEWSDDVRELTGGMGLALIRDTAAAAVAAGLFYEWRDRSGRAYAGYISLPRWGRVVSVLTGLALSGLFVAGVWFALRN